MLIPLKKGGKQSCEIVPPSKFYQTLPRKVNLSSSYSASVTSGCFSIGGLLTYSLVVTPLLIIKT